MRWRRESASHAADNHSGMSSIEEAALPDPQQHHRTNRDRRILRVASWGYLVAGATLMAMFGPEVLTRKVWPPGVEFEMRLGFMIGIATFVGGAYLLWNGRRAAGQMKRTNDAAMKWQPLLLTELREMISRDLAECPDELRAYFDSVAFEPAKWRQTPYGDEGGGFWAVAADENRVLWYNDIEEGFNVSVFTTWGTIPDGEYWCNQDELKYALPGLKGLQMGKFGPPQSGEFGQP